MEGVKESEKRLIIIENKIYAGDQENQLRRYYNYAKEHFKNYCLIYLTLDGHEPSETSLGGGESIEYQTASYRDHILRWIEDCVKEAYDKPLIRETLRQYLFVIKQLTNQDMEEKSKKELIELLSKEENIEQYIKISTLKDDVISHIWSENFIPKLEEALKKTPLYTKVEKSENMAAKYAGITIEVENWKNYALRIEFDKAFYRGLSYGIYYKNEFKDSKTYDKLKNLSGYRHSDAWSIWDWVFEEDRDLKPDTLMAVCSGKVIEKILSKLKEVYKVYEDVSKIDGVQLDLN